MTLRARDATVADAADVARIYNDGIAERIATFETRARTAAEIAESLRRRSTRFPTVVVDDGGRIVGWAGTSEYRPRECYAGIAEFSVYVDRAARGRGVGRIAMDALVAACAARGFWKLVSRVFPENHASRALLRRCGFREVGVYRRHAQLDGEWRDVVIVERLIGAASVGEGA